MRSRTAKEKCANNMRAGRIKLKNECNLFPVVQVKWCSIIKGCVVALVLN